MYIFFEKTICILFSQISHMITEKFIINWLLLFKSLLRIAYAHFNKLTKLFTTVKNIYDFDMGEMDYSLSLVHRIIIIGILLS